MNAPVMGRVYSFESCGMVDGPGLRFVAFLQGCPLRCLYCHNPDSWERSGGLEMSSAQVVAEARKYKTWMDSSGGGLTVSGGEPLAQPLFTEDILKRAHALGISTALDTSGFAPLEKAKACLDAADLVILDIKAAGSPLHRKVCGSGDALPLEVLEYLKSQGKRLWIRHVVVPGLTDAQEDLERLIPLLQGIPCLERFELLPFHKMGEEKWVDVKEDYQLSDTPAPQDEFMDKLRQHFREAGIPVSD
ncbi:MAG: pyruvate formate-lyase-activating protein [Spirochaetales bacterium]|nr:pyruvate formate-lyase-activating protein [Spirochaetales bacterium]